MLPQSQAAIAAIRASLAEIGDSEEDRIAFINEINAEFILIAEEEAAARHAAEMLTRPGSPI